MLKPLSNALLCVLLGSSAIAADAAVAAGEENAPVPATSGPVASGVVFGIITVASDKHSLTVDAKGGPLKLTITPQTVITYDLNKVPITGLAIDKLVRVTYTGTTVDSLDQLPPEKKKKKKS